MKLGFEFCSESLVDLTRLVDLLADLGCLFRGPSIPIANRQTVAFPHEPDFLTWEPPGLAICCRLVSIRIQGRDRLGVDESARVAVMPADDHLWYVVGVVLVAAGR